MTRKDYDKVAKILAYCVTESEPDMDTKTVLWVATILGVAFRNDDISGDSDPFDISRFMATVEGGTR